MTEKIVPKPAALTSPKAFQLRALNRADKTSPSRPERKPPSLSKLMNMVINCPHCNQEMIIDESAVGAEVPCPTCSQNFIIPQGRPEAEVKAERAAAGAGAAAAASMAAAAAGAGATAGAPEKKPEPKKEEKKKAPMPSKEELEKLLPNASKGAKSTTEEDKPGIRVKVVQHHLCIDMGKDKFGETVAKILDPIPPEDIINVSPLSYSYKESGGDIIHDFGVMIIYHHKPKPAEKKDEAAGS